MTLSAQLNGFTNVKTMSYTVAACFVRLPISKICTGGSVCLSAKAWVFAILTYVAGQISWKRESATRFHRFALLLRGINPPEVACPVR